MNKLNLIFAALILTLTVGVITFVVNGGNDARTAIEPEVAAATNENSKSSADDQPLVSINRETINNRQMDALIAASIARQAPALHKGEWLNSEPTTLENLRGRVVLVDFWTFGCYNCRNTVPTLRRFDSEYRDKGLTILGVHTPESDHEKKLPNIRDAVNRLKIKYPIVTDSEGDSWRAFGVEVWPTVVILDKQGRIRYTHVGEGAYTEQEAVIKMLLAEGDDKTANAVANNDDKYNGEKIVKSADEWRKQLTKEQFYVLREKGTERAFTGALTDNHDAGDYHCAACHLKLFSSSAKFDSGTGWPSFYEPVAKLNVTEEVDKSFGSTRTEILCSRCGSHLGHVFDDGPEPTGLRYCMNSVALKFQKKQ